MTSESYRTAYNPPIDHSMRARQLVAMVRQGRSINVDILDEGWFERCYLAGMDADTYFLLRPSGDQIEKYLVPKNHILVMQLNDEQTFREEPLHTQMEEIIKPFRDSIDKNYPKPLKK